MALRKIAGRALVCWIGVVPLLAQTVVKVEQGGTGAASAAGARSKLGAAAEIHSHAISQIDGVSAKSGNSTVLQTFGGGATASGECAQYDAAGNLISTGGPCGGRENYSQPFSGSTSVVLTHNLGTLNVLVECFDVLDAKVEPGGVTIPNVNTAVVSFAVPQTGRCVASGTAGGAGGGAVASVFGRTGSVTAQAGDYNISQITGTVGVSKGGTNQTAWTAGRCVQVSADGTRLESAGTNCATGSVASVFGRTGTVASQVGDYGFSQISGVAAVGQGGTGGTTAAAARTNLLPGYAGQPGKCLKVTGAATDVEWGDCDSGALAVTAGAGIAVSGTTISVDAGVVPAYITASATLSGWSGGVVAAQSCSELSFSLPGATSGDAIAAGWPSDLANGLAGTMYATVNGAIAVRLCNVTASSVPAPEGRTFRATILRTF
ncbi:MAG: hypothetical protein C0504_05165 [Candidatus Solibacter sp.]|nr:hypothetical protein [Candidatus Solibacter sp.]